MSESVLSLAGAKGRLLMRRCFVTRRLALGLTLALVGLVSQDVVSAQTLAETQQLADQGLAAAQNYLGTMYRTGEGVPHDDTQAVAWYRKAADQGLDRAQYNLGVAYRAGEGVPQDFTQAVVWLRRAADQGLAAAQASLGDMYRNGEGVPQDFTEAVAWYRKAAEEGDAGGQSKLGFMYFKGGGVPQDYVEAHKWLNLAASRVTGDEPKKLFAVARDLVAKQMTPAQIPEAQKRATEWQAAFEKRPAE